MAKVLDRANLASTDGLEAAQAAMSDDLALLLSFDEEEQAAPEIPEFRRVPSKADMFNSKIVEEVRERLGPDVMEWLRMHFDAADADHSGDLDRSQVETFVQATYTPQGKHLARFMQWFAHLDGDITKEDYLDGMVKLLMDLNYTFSPSPSPGIAQTVELLSPRSKPPKSPFATHDLLPSSPFYHDLDLS